MIILQRWKVKRRGWAVTIVTFWAVVVFAGLALAFGLPLANGIANLAHALPTYVSQAEHGRGWIGHLVRRYHVRTGSAPTRPSWSAWARAWPNRRSPWARARSRCC